MSTIIQCQLRAHGGPDIMAPIDVLEIAQLTRSTSGEGSLVLVDGTILPIVNVQDVLEQLMMDVESES